MTLLALRADAQTVIEWDFSRGMHDWKGNHYVTDLTHSRRGLSFTSTGVDPWIEGPAIDLRIDRIVKVTVRMHSNANSTGELFYGTHFQAGHSVRFAVNNDADWHDYELIIMEPLGSNTRFRLDPATSEGRIGVAFIRVDELTKWDDPPYSAPVRPEPATTTAGAVTSGPLELRYVGAGIGDFTIEVDNREMALGYGNELLGVLFGDVIEWLGINDGSVTAESDSDGVIVTAYHNDSGGGAWEIRREIRPGPIDGAITMDVRIRVDADRDVMCIPWLTILAGMGTFGPTKSQALLAGLEYLSDEPSSSEADISTPEHVRRVPRSGQGDFSIDGDLSRRKIYWPLSGNRPIGPGRCLIRPTASSTRARTSWGLTGPAVGENRFENDLLAHTPIKIDRERTDHSPTVDHRRTRRHGGARRTGLMSISRDCRSCHNSRAGCSRRLNYWHTVGSTPRFAREDCFGMQSGMIDSAQFLHRMPRCSWIGWP